MLPISRNAETQVDTVLDRWDKDIIRKACFFYGQDSAQIYTVNMRRLTCPSLFTHTLSRGPLFLCQLLKWFALQGVGRNGNTMYSMIKMPNVWERAGIRPLPASLPDKSARLHFLWQPPHTYKEIAELRRVKLGDDSGFRADQSMADYISM